MVTPGPEDDEPPRWARGLRRSWPYVLVSLYALEIGAKVGHHEGLLHVAQALVVLGATTVKHLARSGRRR